MVSDGTWLDESVARRYAWAMLAAHASAWLFFVDSGVLYALRQRVEPLCWPFFEDCWKLRFASDYPIRIILGTYLALIAIGACCLALGRHRCTWAALFLTSLVLAGIVSLDYRFRANQFYMLLSFRFVGISTVAEGLVEFIENESLPFEVVAADPSMMKRDYAIEPIPHLLVVDADGRLKRSVVGAWAGRNEHVVERVFDLALPGLTADRYSHASKPTLASMLLGR